MSLQSVSEAARQFLKAARRVALTGAGISVDCGIPDFRGRGGLWSKFDPDEYATYDVFIHNPAKAWSFYRELGRNLRGRVPGPAHRALAALEQAGLLDGVVTQNIDGLHRTAGSRTLWEIHGNYRELHCVNCGHREAARDQHLEDGPPPACLQCRRPLKPDVVLFGEIVRDFGEADALTKDCDALLVIGTSGTVYPVAELPRQIKRRGGLLVEFNLEATPLSPYCSFLLPGRVDETVPTFVAAALSRNGQE
jgi:NAD-dependent deacetylase